MSTTLALAIASQLPIIAIRTRDTQNLGLVIHEISKRKPEKFNPPKMENGKLYFWMANDGDVDKMPWGKTYNELASLESTLLVVNPQRVHAEMFDAGEVPVPKSLLLKFMTVVTDDEEQAKKLLSGLGGCTIKEAAELARLTMSRDHSLTVSGLMFTRKQFFRSASGLTLVDTQQPFYAPDPALKGWVEREKAWFLSGTDPRMIPRGLLFDGPPGTGKTAGAKWLAESLGVPLYRVDVGGTKNKYVGNSEANMLNNLARLDAEEPCVALFDEVEKIFGVTDHGDATTSTMLSQILWWLAEHKSRVLTVMTTNNSKILPKELYREGRVDEAMVLSGLTTHGQVAAFIDNLMATFQGVTEWNVKAIAKSVPPNSHGHYSQSAVTTACFRYIKDHFEAL